MLIKKREDPVLSVKKCHKVSHQGTQVSRLQDQLSPPEVLGGVPTEP